MEDELHIAICETNRMEVQKKVIGKAVGQHTDIA